MLQSIVALSALILVGGAATAPPRAAPGAGRIEVDVVGLESDRGSIQLALYDSPAGYAGKAPVTRTVTTKTTLPMTRTVFEGLPPGTYAVKAFHDLNGDGKLNLMAIGYPAEPFGFSNGAVVRFGPPSWKAAAFTVGSGGAIQTIVMK